jgi:hypothetical protein
VCRAGAAVIAAVPTPATVAGIIDPTAKALFSGLSGVSQTSRDASITASYTHIFSARTVNNFLAYYGRHSPNVSPV